MTPELRDEALGCLRDALAEGFDDEERIIEGVVDLLSSDDDVDEAVAAELADLAPALYREALAEHQRDMATWPAVTDCDRLDAAFDELNERGIVARHHWWCCQTCGHGAMPEERERALAEGREARGYAFYHVQDTERAADGGGLYLAFGAFSPDDRAEELIAQEVVNVLRGHALAPVWNGSRQARIQLPIIWQRRARPARWTED